MEKQSIGTINDIDKSMLWYYNPNESMRILRYFPWNIKFNNSENYNPDYSSDIKIRNY